MMVDLQIDGGYLVKPFDLNCKDRYVQCVAEIGASYVSVIFSSKRDIEILLNDRSVHCGESTEIRLKENGYGYVTVNVTITAPDHSFEKNFVLAILKPAPDYEILYGLENRPRFHYTAPYGFINDPNGMIYNAYTQEYHLFYQSYPYTQKPGPKHWGHAVTKNLVTFQEYETALYPDDSGAMWSGTAIIDYCNTAKLYDETTRPEARILLIYYARAEQANAGLAYTPDGGRSWVKAENGRHFQFIGAYPGHIDPKVFWLPSAEKWVMFCASGEIFTSVNLWDWHLSGRDQWNECPDIYEIKLEESDEKKYVRTYGGTDYRVGTLRVASDGSIEFIPETDFIPYNGDSLNRRDPNIENILREQGWNTGKTGCFYATQHYEQAPNGRIVSVSWLIERGLDTSETWAGAMTVATEQKLRQHNGEYILYSYPVKEMNLLHDELVFSCKDTEITPDSSNVLENVSLAYADISGRFILDEQVTELGFELRKESDQGCIAIKYDVLNELLVADYSKSKHNVYSGVRTTRMKLPANRTISMRVLLDSIIVESFGNEGEAYISSVFCRENHDNGMALYTIGGNVRIEELDIYSMKSTGTFNKTL